MHLSAARSVARFIVRYRFALGALGGALIIAGAIYSQGRIVRQIADSRAAGRQTTCESTNAIAAAVNLLNSSIQQIVLTSTEQSKANEETYRQLHLPPYEERLKQTKEYTAKLEATKIVPLICEVYVKAPYSVHPKHPKTPKVPKAQQPKGP